MTDLLEQLQQTLGSAYTIERELGGGGMSRVFVAEENALGRKVVIKVLPPELAAAVSLDRFKREIQLTAKLQHPNIVPVLTAGETNGHPYYTMPFVVGESLRARAARDGELPVSDAVKILRDVLSALAYAHENGIVHRDIKPDNVLLTKYNAQVSDFGIAKALTASAEGTGITTSLGVALGSPAYMAPEQVVADPTIDHRADLYAVGVMAYEILTGSKMFGERSPQATMAAHAIERPEPIERKRPSIPPALSALVMKSLEKHAADRPQSAEEMLHVLDGLATPSTGATPRIVSSQPLALIERSRRRKFAALAAVVVIAAVAIAVVFLIRRNPSNPVSTLSTPRLAVLPFENGGAPTDAYFADGMTEAITTRLASISGLSVIGLQSAKRYVGSTKSPQQIGSELGVNYLLTGSVRWDKSQPGRNIVSIRPALLKVTDGTQVWGQPYEAVLAGEFKIQSDVAERVAQALDVALLPHESQALATKPTNDPQAYDDYLKGRFYWNKRTSKDLQQALQYFHSAIARDPGFARAYAGLAEVYVVMPSYTDAEPDSTWPAVRANAEKAIALDSTLGVPHAALGAVLRDQHRWADAEREFTLAMKLEPRYPTTYHWYSRMLASLGKMKEAVIAAEKARALDPLSQAIVVNLGTMQAFAGDYETSIATLKSAVAMDPSGPNPHWAYAQSLAYHKKYQAAITQIDSAIALTGASIFLQSFSAYRAYVEAQAGDTAPARRMLGELKRSPNVKDLTFEIAMLHLTLSERDSSIAWLRTFDEQPLADAFLLRVPIFDPLRSDPRFQSILRRALEPSRPQDVRLRARL
ncbi:MAG: protein kinase [Gemmatimonadaceae bacterium]